MHAVRFDILGKIGVIFDQESRRFFDSDRQHLPRVRYDLGIALAAGAQDDRGNVGAIASLADQSARARSIERRREQDKARRGFGRMVVATIP